MLKGLFKGKKLSDAKPREEVKPADRSLVQRVSDYTEEFFKECNKPGKSAWELKPSEVPLGVMILDSSVNEQIEYLLVALEYKHSDWRKSQATEKLASQLARRSLPWTAAQINRLLTQISQQDYSRLEAGLLRSMSKALEDSATLEACRAGLEQVQVRAKNWYDSADKRKFLKQLAEVMAGQTGAPGVLKVEPDEWGLQAIKHLETLEPTLREKWLTLAAHAAKSSGSSPSQKWLEAGKPFLEAVGTESFAVLAGEWFGLFARSSNKAPNYALGSDQRGCLMDENNADLLRGLAWLSAKIEGSRLAASLGDAAIAGYKKISGVGPRSAKIAGACIYALKNMPGLDAAAQLERVKMGVKQPTYLKLIENALEEAATRAGLSREDLEELTVPTFDLLNGARTAPFGQARAEIKLNGLEVSTQWFGADGKERKSVPSDVKTSFKDELKTLKKTIDDLEKMLSAQRDRLERLPLQRRSWLLGIWKSRYLEQPLLAGMVRNLIWTITDGATITDAMWSNDGFQDSHGQRINPSSSATITAWHACHCDASEVLAWREHLERNEIKQPFKQAHREVYILTEAERRTRTYSNRFAAHIIKQHQFNALCAARGWRNQLRLMVDDSYYPPTLELPQWGLRAEYWVEGAGNDYGVDTNETGTYLYLATDQVRFYPLESARNTAHAGGGGYETTYDWQTRTRGLNEAIPLEQIPAVVFSEILRDVDLFVGVASVGNDPTWVNGGPEGHREYWQSYSFGDLSATAESRKATLEMLVPRLKIKDRARVDGKFLKVRGEIRTYKIHLGSGNILMEPNDQYLCIVPGSARDQVSTSELRLPFEGDRVLAIILSKAFMLAEDTKITDETITRQLGR
jgi:Domain of unknown function (DUF4132)